jgi:hypothetical protein
MYLPIEEPVAELAAADDTVGEAQQSELASQGAGPLTTIPDCASIPTATELDELDKRRFESDASFAGSLSQGLFSGSGGGRRLVVVEDFYRGKYCTAPSGERLLYGAAVRLRVGISEIKAEMKLTLPFIAASAEVGSARAFYHLSVKGYTGPNIAELIPEPGDFNVETYVGLMDKITKIQKLLTSDTANIKPVRLAIDVPDTDAAFVLRSSVGTTWALSQIADGKNLNDALQAYDWSDEASAAITATYRKLDIADGSQPHGDATRAAQAMLGRLRLRR